VRVTQHYGLKLAQAQVDFVDVDVENDVRLFVDPQAFLSLPSPWAHECVAVVQDFFERVIIAIRAGDLALAHRMLSGLREPNDTHLGLSRSRSRGTALGDGFAEKILESLIGSKAAESGLLQDLEDTALLVKGIDRDRISDITTNVLRRQLLDFTLEVCEYYGIPTVDDVASGPMWRQETLGWEETYVRRPVAEGTPLLLVPKSIVRSSPAYDSDEYYRNYILSYLEQREMGAGGSLIKVARSGRRTVTRGDLRAKYGVGKPVNLRWSQEDPELLAAYKEHKRKHPTRPLENEDLAEKVGAPADDYVRMLEELRQTPTGKEHADEYHRRVEGLLTAVFYPLLVNPRREHRIHDGRKRIDITYTNAAQLGVFNWIGQHYPAPFIFVECKNYSAPIGNSEFDQIAGRFSPSKGKVGLLVYRGFDDKQRTLQSCRDTARDQRGIILAIDDEDLAVLVDERTREPLREYMGLLHERFIWLVS